MHRDSVGVVAFWLERMRTVTVTGCSSTTLFNQIGLKRAWQKIPVIESEKPEALLRRSLNSALNFRLSGIFLLYEKVKHFHKEVKWVLWKPLVRIFDFHFLCTWNTRQVMVFFFMFCWNIFPLMWKNICKEIRTLVLKSKNESCFEGANLILWLTFIKDNSKESKRNPAELLLLGAREFHCQRVGSLIASIIIREIFAHFPNYCASKIGYGERFYLACLFFMEKYFHAEKMFCSDRKVADIQKIRILHHFHLSRGIKCC